LLSAAVPSVVAPSLKVITPVGIPVPGATELTVAVSVTDWFSVDGFGDALNKVWVEIRLTVCVTVAELLAISAVLPP
jgi:hypothetical protein